MKITVAATVHFNGHPYASPTELSPSAQAAYQNNLAPGGISLNERLGKIVLYGKELTGLGRNGNRIYDDIIGVVENNGHVTLPRSTEHRFTARQIAIGVAVLVALATLAVAVLAKAGN